MSWDAMLNTHFIFEPNRKGNLYCKNGLLVSQAVDRRSQSNGHQLYHPIFLMRNGAKTIAIIDFHMHLSDCCQNF